MYCSLNQSLHLRKNATILKIVINDATVKETMGSGLSGLVTLGNSNCIT